MSAQNKMNSKAMTFSKETIDTLKQAFKPYITQMGLLLVVGLVSRVLFLSNAQVIAHEVDQVDQINRTFLVGLSYKVLIILAVSLILTIIYRVMFSRFSSLAVSSIYDETTYRVTRFPLSFFDVRPVGSITTRFSSDYSNMFRLFGGPLAEFLSIIFDLIGVVLIILWINPLFGISVLLTTFLYYYIFKINQKSLRESRKNLSVLRAPSIAHFSETTQGALNIRQGNTDESRLDIFIHRFKNFDFKFTSCRREVFYNAFKFSFQLSLMSFFIFVANAAISLYLYQEQKIGAGEMTIVISYTLLATTGLQMFFEWYSQFDEALIGVERMNEYIRRPIEPLTFLPLESKFETGHPKKALRIRRREDSNLKVGDLILNQIKLKYSENGPEVLNLSLNIPEGQKLGVIGRTGSGKTSLISSILKLYPLSSGDISFSDYSYESLQDYRENFAVVTQDIFFMRGSLRMNLDLTGLFSDEHLLQVLHQVGLYNLSLDLMVEEKGQNLSQGEKQLLSLARGLLKNAPIIIFDEATANIDPQSEQKVTEVIQDQMKDRTQIIIAHRLDTLLYCDRVIWLEQGQIKKDGPAKEVLEAFTARG